MVKDLRTFLQEREKAHPNDIVRIKKEVSCRYEVTAIQRKLDSMGKFPILIFENPITVQGVKSNFNLLTNLTASRRICADALGISFEKAPMEYLEKSSKKGTPEIVSRKDAPVKEIIEKDSVDLEKFPIVVHHESDPGAYITAGFVTTYDPNTGIDNTSLQRLWVQSKNKIVYWAIPNSHNWNNVMKFWESNEDAPVAIWIGHHPAVVIGAQSKLDYPESHYPYVCGLIGEPLRLIPTETFGDKLLVPADAEIVIEGLVQKGVYEEEGPFGEYHGYYSEKTRSFVIKVKCITHRRNAIYHDIGPGLPDHIILDVFPLEAKIYKTVKSAVPELMNVHVPLSGTCKYHAYIQVKKKRPGVGRLAVVAALTSARQLRHVFVVDDDINIFNEREVLWALATRTEWDKDVIILPDLPAFVTEPALLPPKKLGAKAGIDCTKPLPEELHVPYSFPQVTKVPDEVMKSLDLAKYIDKDKMQLLPSQ